MINTHRGIIYKICHVYDPDKVYREDLFQEIVLQLWRSFPNFRNESLSSTWMYRVALNTAISHFRRQVKKPEGISLSHEEFILPDLAAFPEDNDNALALNEAIHQLSRIEKAIIILHLEEKNYSEIGEIMGITVNNVGVKLNRIKIKLEQIIKKDRQ